MKTTNILDRWGKGQLLACSGLNGETDFENGLILRTEDSAAMQIKQPGENGEIIFAPGIPESCFLSSDCFRINGSTGLLPDTHHLLLEGKAEFKDLPDCFSILRKGNRTLLGVKEYFRPGLIDLELSAEFRRRVDFFAKLPDFGIEKESSLKTLAKAYSQLKGQICSPCRAIPCRWTTPDRWPHRAMWLWDSVFHAIGLRHFDPELAKETLTAVLESQLEDGLIPHMTSPVWHSDITQPPVLAFGIRLLTEERMDETFLRRSYPRLKRYLEWIMTHRDADGMGLVEWAIEGNPLCRSGESGMDNSPRFDSATKLDAPDFNAFLSLECECMAEFAERLSLKEEAEKWRRHHIRLNAKINELLWNDAERIYMDRDIASGKLTGISASSGFLPLICGAPSRAQTEKLVANLKDPETFATPFRVPSISRKCSAFYQKDMWRGPVWININWLIAFGLERCGCRDEARELLEETVREEEKFYLKYGTFFEFYDDRGECDPPELMRKGKNSPSEPYHQSFHDYGWSASLYIDMIRKLHTGKL